MEHSNNMQEQNLKKPFTIFGEPVVKTQCQRNALIVGISGGIMSGLVAFLFTSQARKSTHIAVGGCFTITFVMATYCAYSEYTMRKQARMIKAAIYNLNQIKKEKELNDVELESV